jgi:hypothetical protein
MMGKTLFVTALIILLLETGTVSAKSSMRCGRNLVELGDHKNLVYELCGEPESIDVRTKIVGSILHHPRRTLDLQQYEEVEVEEWVYYLGHNRFRQYLRFENGRLVDVQDLSKGR